MYFVVPCSAQNSVVSRTPYDRFIREKHPACCSHQEGKKFCVCVLCEEITEEKW